MTPLRARYTPWVGRNQAPIVALVFAALLIARYLLVHDRAIGLGHGPSRAIVGVLFLLVIVGIRMFMRRRRP
jgi:hypothetical protein